jgi:hypothetical protein
MRSSPERSSAGQLVEDLGIETLGGVVTPPHDRGGLEDVTLHTPTLPRKRACKNRHQLTRLVLGLVALTGLGGCAVRGWLFPEPPSVRRARGSIVQILFVSDRVLIQNELGEMLTSDLTGGSWTKLSERAHGLVVARGREIWGAHGWPGHHECPRGNVWYSPDGGGTWIASEIGMPCEHHSDLVNARLPGGFINGPSDDPLLLMFNLQLVRPRPGEDVSSWQPVGRPIPGVERLFRWRASGTHSRGVAYVAVANRIFMSRDEGGTWIAREVHPFFDAEIRCHGARCFALLSQLGSEWSGLFTTDHGINEWKLVATLDEKSVGPLLTRESGVFGAMDTFGTTALLADAHGVFVSGIANAGGQAWGAVVRVDKDGALEALTGGVAFGLWDLARAPDQTLWAAGMGVYRRDRDGWTKLWTDRGAENAARPNR